jgi:uncharacterized protein (TIGR03067 family)
VRSYIVLSLACGFLLSAAGRAADTTAKKELDRLQGVWVVESMQQDAKATSKLKKWLKVEIKDNVRLHTLADGSVIRRLIALHPAKDLRRIEFYVEEDGKKVNTKKGIYQLDGDTLTLCFPIKWDGTPPRDFATPDDSGTKLVVLKRAKK